MSVEKTWTELVAPMVNRCEVAAKFGMNATWNADGAAALGELIKRMAARLDADLEAVRAVGENAAPDGGQSGHISKEEDR